MSKFLAAQPLPIGDQGEDAQGALASGVSWQVIFHCAVWYRCSTAPGTGAVIAILPLGPCLVVPPSNYIPYHRSVSHRFQPHLCHVNSWAPPMESLPSLQIRQSTLKEIDVSAACT